MTTSFSVPAEPARPSNAATVAIALIASVAVFGLFIAGITFAALAVAFPMVGSLADQFPIQFSSVSAGDLALAGQFADAWWVFGALAIGSLVGALVVVIKAIQHLSPNVGD